MERLLSGRPADNPSMQGRGNGTRKAIQGDAAQRSSTRGEGDAAQRSSTRGEGDAAQRSSTRGEGDAAERSSTGGEGDAAQRSSTRGQGGPQRGEPHVGHAGPWPPGGFVRDPLAFDDSERIDGPGRLRTPRDEQFPGDGGD